MIRHRILVFGLGLVLGLSPVANAQPNAAAQAEGGGQKLVELIKLPTMGGSVPLYMIEEMLHTPTITVPIANHDSNQHSFNENIRIQNLWDGIELMAALLAM